MIIKRACFFALLVGLLSACSWLPAPSTGKVPTETLAPTPTGTVRVVETKAPTLTLEATQIAGPTPAPTEEPVLPTPEPPAPSPLPVRYGIQYGTPAGLANFVAPEAGCAWFGIGGQAFDLSGNPVSSLVVEVGGVLAGTEISKLSMSGSSSVLGPGGYVMQLGDAPIASDGSLWIRLIGLDGLPLTGEIYFTTYSDCERNLVLINFVENTPNLEPRLYLPRILREATP